MSTHSGLRNSFGFADNNGSGCDGNQTSRLTRRFKSCVSLHMHEVEQRLKCDDKATSAQDLAARGDQLQDTARKPIDTANALASVDARRIARRSENTAIYVSSSCFCLPGPVAVCRRVGRTYRGLSWYK